MFPMLANP